MSDERYLAEIEIRNLRIRIECLEAALGFYADPEIYADRTPYEGDSNAWADGGAKARAALHRPA